MKKRLFGVLVVFLLVMPLSVIADDCGFFCKVNKFLWGDAALRENVAGKAVGTLPPAAQANINELDRASWRGKDPRGREYYQGPADPDFTYYRITDSETGNYYIYKEYTASDPAKGYIPLPDFVGAKVGDQRFQTDAQMLASIEHPLQDSANLIYGTSWNERETSGVLKTEVLTSAGFPEEESTDIAIADLPDAKDSTAVTRREGPATQEQVTSENEPLGVRYEGDLPADVPSSTSGGRYAVADISGGRQVVYDTEDSMYYYGSNGQPDREASVSQDQDLRQAQVQLAVQGDLPDVEVGRMSSEWWQEAVAVKSRTQPSNTYRALTSEQETSLRADGLGDADIGALRQNGLIQRDGTTYVAGRESLFKSSSGSNEVFSSEGWEVSDDLAVQTEIEAVAGSNFGITRPELSAEQIAQEQNRWATLGGTPQYTNNEVHAGEEEYYQEGGNWYRRRDFWPDEQMDSSTSTQLAQFQEDKQWEMVAIATGNQNVNLVSGSWIEQDITNPQEALAWVEKGVINPAEAKQFKERSVQPSDPEVAEAVASNRDSPKSIIAVAPAKEDTGSAGEVDAGTATTAANENKIIQLPYGYKATLSESDNIVSDKKDQSIRIITTTSGGIIVIDEVSKRAFVYDGKGWKTISSEGEIEDGIKTTDDKQKDAIQAATAIASSRPVEDDSTTVSAAPGVPTRPATYVDESGKFTLGLRDSTNIASGEYTFKIDFEHIEGPNGEKYYRNTDGIWERESGSWYTADPDMDAATNARLNELREEYIQLKSFSASTALATPVVPVSSSSVEQPIVLNIKNKEISLAKIEGKVAEVTGITASVNDDNSVELLYTYNQNKALSAEEAILTTTPQVITSPQDYLVTAQSNGVSTPLVLVDVNGEKSYYAAADIDQDKKPLAGKTRYLMTRDTVLKIETKEKIVITPAISQSPLTTTPTPSSSSLQTDIDNILVGVNQRQNELSKAEAALVTAQDNYKKNEAGEITPENIVALEAAKKAVEDAKKNLAEAEEKAEDQLRDLRDKTYSDAEFQAVVANLQGEISKAEGKVKAAGENVKKAKEAVTAAGTDEKKKKEAEGTLADEEKKLATAQKTLSDAKKDYDLQSKALPTEWQGGSALAYAYTFITSTPRFPAISNAIFGDMKGWRQTTERLFANTYLGGWVTDGVCGSSLDVNEEGASTSMMEVAPNIYQSAGSIQAERSQDSIYPLLCSLEEENPQPCPGTAECREGVCFQDKAATEPLMGYLYKITWSVSAPQDLGFTARQDEGRNEIDFNLKLDEVWIFHPDDGTSPNANTIHLGVGNTSRNLPLPPIIIEYFSDKYEQACIIFGENKPLKNYRAGGGSIEEICATFKEVVEAGTVSVLLDESGAPVQTTTTNVQYCGLDGKC